MTEDTVTSRLDNLSREDLEQLVDFYYGLIKVLTSKLGGDVVLTGEDSPLLEKTLNINPVVTPHDVEMHIKVFD